MKWRNVWFKILFKIVVENIILYRYEYDISWCGSCILEVDTASHSGLLYAAEGENILYFTIEMITFSLLKFFGSVSELICA